ncbi:MAG TPA: hypothetical protein VEV38_13180 [Candidatus Eremiobacteraceae bacterium]|nr:hypothetical protein [Candidatus Eremiobacteraceae bacterium]
MLRPLISWSAIVLCVFWVGWFIFDSYYNSGLIVYAGVGSKPEHAFAIDAVRATSLFVELASTALVALVLTWLARNRD